jgi:GMP synthase-like glutamine amidotransferase
MTNLTIGILLTDHVIPELIVKHGDQTDFYNNIFSQVDPSIQLKFYDVILDDYPNHIDECDGYLITGSKLSVYDSEEWIRKLEVYVQTLDLHKKSLLGVCFGHQLIARALGGAVEKADVGWTLGVQNYKFTDVFPWVENQNSEVSLIHSHQDQVTSLPSRASLVAGNKKVPNAMFKIEDHVMCIQGHPEFTPEYALSVATKRKEILGKELYDEARHSLTSKKPDNKEVVAWWIDFFKHNNQ